MDFGAVLQPDPDIIAQIDSLSQKIEAAGFTHLWTFDSHVLWPEAYVIYPQILAATEKLIVGPMVTNPITRDPSVIAAMHATLALCYGNRTICGIGRGDSAVRVLGGTPMNLKEFAIAIAKIQALANGGSYHNVELAWNNHGKLKVWVAAYGPQALAITGKIADGYILQLADPTIAEWMISAVKCSAEKAGRDPNSLDFCIAAPMYVGNDRTHMYQQCRWFGAMVGNHIADIIARYGDRSPIPKTLSDYVQNRTEYDYSHHGKAANTSAGYVPDEIVERFCILGSTAEHRAKLEQLRCLGVTQFAGYLQHDDIHGTIHAYQQEIIPQFTAKKLSSS